jgi:myo-inositol-1(or 4)-monophosphatase
MEDLAQDFDLLREAARDAASLAKSFWGHPVAQERKTDGSTVTEADIAVDKLLSGRLRAGRPDYG